MKCSTTHELIDPYLDDELDVNRKAEVEAHLETCPECAGLQAQLQELRNDIRTLAPRHTAPPGLQHTVLKHLRQLGKGESSVQAPTWRGFAIAASILLAAALSWDVSLVRSRRGDRDVIAREVVSSHIRSLMGTHLLDVPSSDRHTVKPWFNGKLDFSPVVEDFAAEGFPLIGGRIEYFIETPAAALVYKRRGHIINVFTWPASQSIKSSPALTEKGYNVISWAKAGMIYWTVSDLNRSELEQFVRLYDK